MAIFKCLLILAVFAAIKEREKDTTVTGENNKHILYLCTLSSAQIIAHDI